MIGFETFLGSWGRGQDGFGILGEPVRFGHVVAAIVYRKFTYEVAMACSWSRVVFWKQTIPRKLTSYFLGRVARENRSRVGQLMIYCESKSLSEPTLGSDTEKEL